MTKFNLQIRNPETRKWDTQQTVNPQYKYATLKFRRYLFFHTTYGVIPNLLRAEKQARKLAIRISKKLYGHLPARVERVSTWNAVEVKDVVWCNRKARASAVTG